MVTVFFASVVCCLLFIDGGSIAFSTNTTEPTSYESLLLYNIAEYMNAFVGFIRLILSGIVT